MGFWVIFYIVPIILVLIFPLLKVRGYKCVEKIFVIYIWAVSAFRYMVGDDYSSYISYYHNTTIDDGIIGFKEPLFNIVIWLGNLLGLDYQFLFIVYSTITIFFIYRGVGFYVNDDRNKLLFMMLYTSFFAGGYYWGLNVIRQAAAIAVLFWGSKYLIEKKESKFILVYLFAICIHYSALIYLLSFFALSKRKFSNIEIVGLFIVAFLMSEMQFSEKIFYVIAGTSEFLNDKYGMLALMVDNSNKDDMISSIVLVSSFFVANIFTKNNSECYAFCRNMCVLYLVLRILSSSSAGSDLVSSLMTRITVYFSLFYLLFVIFFIEGQKKSMIIQYLLSVVMVFSFVLVMLYIISGSNNVEYQYNFNLFV